MEKEIKFPDYCCFGKRKSGQLFETADGIIAVYEMFGIKVHELSYKKRKEIWTLSKGNLDYFVLPERLFIIRLLVASYVYKIAFNLSVNLDQY